ncbi:hypothetical protein E1181_02765 [Saccharopolyspora terrae]|uniref:Uncharacterized protein n=1 Tax=Saccharopolyspora terrae TaxID=2530384 RepID=A0A4R4W2R1_9PSEU|nr:hypothetical protein [Saccharopolyspora terrae]TDD10173.1 hypothetical protein E1181_02765 [Saccharopolyspora terrae]
MGQQRNHWFRTRHDRPPVHRHVGDSLLDIAVHPLVFTVERAADVADEAGAVLDVAGVGFLSAARRCLHVREVTRRGW